MGALEGAGRRAVFLAQAALELRDGFVFVLLHPGHQFLFDDFDVPGAVPDERGTEHGHVRPGHEHFQHVGRAMDAAGGRQATCACFAMR